MALFRQILVTALAALRAGIRPPTRYWPLWAAAALLVFPAAGFLVAAGYLALASLFEPPVAALLSAAGLLLLAAVLLLIAVLPRRRAGRSAASAELAAAIVDLSEMIAKRLPVSSPSLAVGALLAGLAVGYSPGLRRFLIALAKNHSIK